MAEPKDTLEGKVEYALIAVLSDAGLEAKGSLYAGHEFEEREGNQIVVACMGGPEIGSNTGNYLEQTLIKIRTPADRPVNETQVQDPREVHREIVQMVREAIFTPTIEADLTEQEDDFDVGMVNVVDSGQTTVEGRYFVTEIQLEVSCVRADFD